MAENPAKHFRLDHVKGALTPGRDADIVVLEPRESVYDAAASGNNVAGWSPYNGIRLPWTVTATYLRGRQIAKGSTVTSEAGTGRFVRPLPRQVISGETA
jgi:allantoinase